jgi:imidazolonepropionase-like amidohydrolase
MKPFNTPAAMVAAILISLPNTLWATETCVENARLLDGQRDEVAIICFDESGITSIGAAAVGATIVDGTGMVLTPGFIDTGNALGLVEISQESPTVDDDAGSASIVRAGFIALDAYNPWSSLIGVARSGGVTGSLVIPGGGIVSGTGGFVHFPEDTSSEHVVVADSVVVFSMGEWAGETSGGARGEVVGVLRSLFEDARFLSENRAAYDAGQLRELAADASDLDAIVRVLDGEATALIHANRAADIRGALRLGETYGFVPIIMGGAEAWAIGDQLAEAGVAVVLNPLMNLPASFDELGAREDNAALLNQAGVEVVFASYDTHNARTIRQLAGNAVRAGMDYNEAIASLTRRAAAVAGVGDRFGRLESGFAADLVLWTGDPLEFSTQVEAMWIGGQAQTMRNRQQALRDRYLR